MTRHQLHLGRAVVVLGLVGVLGPWGVTAIATSAAASAALADASTARLTGLSVEGTHLVDGRGVEVRLHGVNRSGTEYACVQGQGIFDGPSSQASVAAIAAWHANIVRIPLNEDCWLGINGVDAAYSGANYRDAITAYVSLLHRDGMYAELALTWGAPEGYEATYQPPAPDESHAPAMWASMARAFKGDPDVILSPWGETTVPWSCFMRTGCDNQATYGPANAYYETAPMQQAVTIMRAAGYRGIIAVSCIDLANACGKVGANDYDGSTWLGSRPNDPRHQLIAEAHVYGKNTCDTVACFDASMLPITKVVPLLFGELGESYDASDCGASYTSTFMKWADAHGVGYEAWAWDTWKNCGVLISSYAGTPYSGFGTWVRAHFGADAGRPPVTLK